MVEAVCRLARQGRAEISPRRKPAKIEPVGWWRFEPDGLLADASGCGHDLAANRGAAADGEPAPTAGSKAGAVFNGQSYLEGGRLQLPNAANETGLTLAAWGQTQRGRLERRANDRLQVGQYGRERPLRLVAK